jgi:hypothetical protein
VSWLVEAMFTEEAMVMARHRRLAGAMVASS